MTVTEQFILMQREAYKRSREKDNPKAVAWLALSDVIAKLPLDSLAGEDRITVTLK